VERNIENSIYHYLKDSLNISAIITINNIIINLLNIL
jgi:hypothetical protein